MAFEGGGGGQAARLDHNKARPRCMKGRARSQSHRALFRAWVHVGSRSSSWGEEAVCHVVSGMNSPSLVPMFYPSFLPPVTTPINTSASRPGINIHKVAAPAVYGTIFTVD